MLFRTHLLRSDMCLGALLRGKLADMKRSEEAEEAERSKLRSRVALVMELRDRVNDPRRKESSFYCDRLVDLDGEMDVMSDTLKQLHDELSNLRTYENRMRAENKWHHDQYGVVIKAMLERWMLSYKEKVIGEEEEECYGYTILRCLSFSLELFLISVSYFSFFLFRLSFSFHFSFSTSLFLFLFLCFFLFYSYS